jgi:integrase
MSTAPGGCGQLAPRPIWWPVRHDLLVVGAMRGSVHRRGSTWSAMWDEPTLADGKRRQRKKGGFTTKKAAQQHVNLVLTSINRGSYVAPSSLTMQDYLTNMWLPSLGVRLSTRRSYEGHVTAYLIPHLGRIPLQRLTAADLRRMYSALRAAGSRKKPLSATTVQRVHATVRSALSHALREDLVTRNVAKGIRLETPPKPEMQVWSQAEVLQFLATIKDDPWRVLYEFIIRTGVRRGEAVGLRWADVNLDEATVSIRQQIIDNGYSLVTAAPKTRRGERRFAIDPGLVEALRTHRAVQSEERLRWGAAYQDAGLVFARANGNSLHPDFVTKHFNLLVAKSRLSRIRLHDLRHTHASLLLAQGAHLKTVSERLGHSSIVLTLDTYSHVSPAMDQGVAATIHRLLG